MSDQPSKGAPGRTSPSQPHNSAEQPNTTDTTSGTSGRKRSNTRHRVLPPAIHLSLKTSSLATHSASTVNLNQEELRTPRSGGTSARARELPSSAGSASRSDYSSKQSGTSTSKYGTLATPSSLKDSPASLSSSYGGDLLSSSLPVTLSPLSGEHDLDLASPSPASSRLSPRDKPPSPFLAPHGVSNLRIPPTSRAASAPTSRKSSAASLDREACLHLDMKRLLSKPALTSHSGSSIISLPSDHDTSSASPSPRHPRSFAELSKRPRASGTRRLDSGNATDGGVGSSPLRTLREAASRVSLPAAVYEAEHKQTHKVRNVLKRRPSARSNPATPTLTTFRINSPEDPNTTPRASRTVVVDVKRPEAPRRAASAIAEPVSVNRVRRAHTPPPNLTPAGQVALAYKQQEQRREELAEISGWNDQMRQDGSFRSVDNPLRHAEEEEDEEGSGAYYTVFGSSSGRVVAVGSAEDSSWDLDFDAQFGPEERVRMAGKMGTTSPGSSASVGVRSLSRKVSGRFKKVAGSTRRVREVSPHGIRRISEAGREEWAPFDGRPSMHVQERGPVNAPKRSLGASTIDEYVDVPTHVGSSIPSIPNGRSEKSRKEREGRPLRTMRSFKGKEKESDKVKDDESSPGGKLWKLVKRISTGGLRDKYVRESSPPPVPALPKDFQHLASSRTTLDIRKPSGRDSPADLSVARFIQSRSSMSVVRPSSAPQKGSPRSEHPTSRPSTGARPSTTTRSSSPMSSDIASARFFNKTHSAHSSISSYGEELPPLPQGASGIGHHIMSPSELYKLNKDSADANPKKTRSRTRSQSAAAAPFSHADDRPPPSLPPPRRSNTAGGKPASQHELPPPSPTIPTFNTLSPINNFTPPRLSLPTSEFGILTEESTPPRPKRSSRRKPPPELASPTASTPISPPMPVTPRSPRSPNVPAISVDVSRTSISSRSTGRDLQSSTSGSATRSPLRFREMESPRQLSEREKAAKWDDLLERSDRAGGTLHIGESGLMSDTVRFSDYSELSDLS